MLLQLNAFDVWSFVKENMKEPIREEYELWEWEKFSECVHG